MTAGSVLAISYMKLKKNYVAIPEFCCTVLANRQNILICGHFIAFRKKSSI